MTTPRYAVCIKTYSDDKPRAVAWHPRSAREAGRTLAKLIRTTPALEQAFVRDQYCPGENKPGASCCLSRNQILHVYG